jgi:hypothetical protein
MGKPNRRSEEEKDGRERNDQSLARSFAVQQFFTLYLLVM